MTRLTVLLVAARWALNAVALAGIGFFFIQHRAAIGEAAAEFDTATILTAITTVVVGLLPGAWAWQQVCQQRLPGVTASHGTLVYLRSAVGKYTPGGVLTFVIQQRLLGRHGSSPVMLLQIFVGTALAACLAAGLLGLPAAVAFGAPDIGVRWIVLGLLLALPVLGLAYRARRRPILTTIRTKAGIPPPLLFMRATLLLAGATALTGLHLAVLGVHTGGDTLFLVSAYALSTIAGLVFAVLPGALGVRDGALLLILITRLAPADAAMLAILSRALIVSGDVIGAALSALALRLTRPALHLERSPS